MRVQLTALLVNWGGRRLASYVQNAHQGNNANNASISLSTLMIVQNRVGHTLKDVNNATGMNVLAFIIAQ